MQPSLFSEPQTIQLLDNCQLSYWPAFKEEQQHYFDTLKKELNWQQGKVFIAGKWVNSPRLEAYYADSAKHYRYSGKTLEINPWHPMLQTLLTEVQSTTGHSYNAVLANYYRSGQDSMGFHADDEPELGENPIIATLSFGGPRKFQLKHKASKETVAINVEPGSLLLMGEGVQRQYLHGINKVKQAEPRISLTFRQIIL